MANSWGISSLFILACSFFVTPFCRRLFHAQTPLCPLIYISSQIAAFLLAMMAAMRENKLWALVSLFSGLFICQALFAIFAGDI
jgi:hypothetical protein